MSIVAVDSPLAIPSCRITPTGLVIEGELTEERWLSIGESLSGVSRRLMWLVGDWLLAGESAGYLPRGKLQEACERFGIEYKTAQAAVGVCRAFESSMRIDDLSFSHHQLVAGSDRAEDLLQWAAGNSASVQDLRAEKNRRQAAAEAKERRKAQSAGKQGESEWSFQVGDCEHLPFPDDYFDLVFCSPPYESQRAYSEIAFCKSGEEWVGWAVACFEECLRVCKGLVAWVVEGFTGDFAYSSTPFLLLADLHRKGVKIRKPCVFKRNGIPGTGGPDWLRNDWEPIICATKNGKLPWAEPTAMGAPPKQNKPRYATNRNKDGSRKQALYVDPEVCNPGNVIEGLVGCGGLGWRDAHENEAPFPEWLAEFFVKSFCPPGGIVLDPFSGSGTTVHVAVRHGRNGIGVDARESQVWLGETRLMGLTVSERKSGQGMLC